MPPRTTEVVRSQRWGTRSALLDDAEARRRLVAAAEHCIVRNGTGRLRIEDVAEEAGVSRATVYRYFSSRDELVVGVLLTRHDRALTSVVGGLSHPHDPSRSIPDIILTSLAMIDGNPVNEALFASDSRPLVTTLELTADAVVDQFHAHVGPLLERWQAEGRLQPDLDLRETSRWINAVALLLTSAPYRSMTAAAKRRFLERYLVRAVVVAAT